MAPKITTGASIRSCLEYDLASKDGEPAGEWICGSLVGSAREMARQASFFRALRPDCKKAIWSCSLSLPPADGRRTAENWAEITQSFFKKMGIEQSKYAWAAHRHTHQNDHIHIRLCRVGSDGVLWNQEHSARRAIKACAELEVEFDLNKHDRTPAPKTRPSRAEVEISKRKGTPMSREKIQDSVDEIIKNHPEGIYFHHLQKLLSDKNVGMYDYASGGVLKGVSYSCDGLKWPGSKIGREYSAGLAERGVRYQAGAQVGEAEELQAPTATPTPAVPARDKYSRAPGALRQILRDGNSANQIMPLGARPAASWADKVVPTFDMEKFSGTVGDLDVGPLSKAMLLLGAATIGMGLEIIKAIIRMLQWLLAKLGFGLRPVSQNTSGTEQHALGYEPYYLEADVREVDVEKTAEQQAADVVLQIVAGLAHPESLPQGEGREELIAELAKQKESAAAEVEANPLDDVFGTDMEAQPAQAPEPAQGIAATTAPAAPQKPLWAAFIESAETLKLARAAVARASEKDFFYTDERTAAWRQRDALQDGLQKLEADFASWRAAHKVAAALGADPHKFGQRISSQRAEIERVAGLVKAAERKDVAAKIAYDATPAPVVPAELLEREKGANAALRQSRILLMAKARQNLQILTGYPVLKQQKEALALKLQRLDGRLDSFMEDPKMKPDFFAELEKTLRELHAAVAFERARLAPAPDAEPVDPDAPRA